MLKKERAPGLGEGEIEHAIWLQTALFVLLEERGPDHHDGYVTRTLDHFFTFKLVVRIHTLQFGSVSSVTIQVCYRDELEASVC